MAELASTPLTSQVIMPDEASPSEMSEELTFQFQEHISSDVIVSPSEETNLDILNAELSFFVSPRMKDFESAVHSSLKNIDLTCAVDYTTLCGPSPMNTISLKSQPAGSLTRSAKFDPKFSITEGKRTMIHDKAVSATDKEMFSSKSRHLRGESGSNHHQLITLFGTDRRSHDSIDAIAAFLHGYEGVDHKYDRSHPESEESDGDHHNHDHNHPGSEGPDGDHHNHDHDHDHRGSEGSDGDHHNHDHDHPGSEGPDGDRHYYLEVDSPQRSRCNDGESARPLGQWSRAHRKSGSKWQDKESVESWSDLEDDGDREDHSYRFPPHDEGTDLDYFVSLGYGDLGDMCMLSKYNELSPKCQSAVNHLTSLQQQYDDGESTGHRGSKEHCHFLIFVFVFVGLMIFKQFFRNRKGKGDTQTMLSINDANHRGETGFQADRAIATTTTTTTSVNVPLNILTSIRNTLGGITPGLAAPSAADGAYSSLPSDISEHGSRTPMNIVTGVPIPPLVTAEQQGTTNWI